VLYPVVVADRRGQRDKEVRRVLAGHGPGLERLRFASPRAASLDGRRHSRPRSGEDKPQSPRSPKACPAKPWTKTIGKNTATVVRVEATTVVVSGPAASVVEDEMRLKLARQLEEGRGIPVLCGSAQAMEP